MSDFEKFKAAIALLNKHSVSSSSHADLALKLYADTENQFFNLDFIGYISALENEIGLGLSETLGAVCPDVDEEESNG